MLTPFTNALLMIYKLIGGNFGIAIILFTILIRLITHPLMVSQIKGSTKMQEMQNSKEWQDIQKKYKDDKEKLAQEQMKYYKEIGYNPLSSCLPSVIQIPLIFGLYQSIMRALAASPGQLLTLTRTVYPFLSLVWRPGPAEQQVPLDEPGPTGAHLCLRNCHPVPGDHRGDHHLYSIQSDHASRDNSE